MLQQAIEVDNKGQTIRGTAFRPAAYGRFPTVLVLHGFTGSRAEGGFLHIQLARRLAKAGIATVLFDFRNSGESDGSFEKMLVTEELDDSLRMTQWLLGQPFVDRTRTALLGFSLGGLLAACTTARVDTYKALVLLAPTTVNNLMRFGQRGQDNRISIGPHLLHPRIFEDIKALNPVADVVKNPRPTLVVQGAADESVPPSVSQAYVDAIQRARLPLEYQLVDGADHAFFAVQPRAEMLAAVTAFLTRQFGM